MEKKCVGSLKGDARNIADNSDTDIRSGMASHADPNWWKEGYVMRTNQAYLRRYGALLRREARRRGLL